MVLFFFISTYILDVHTHSLNTLRAIFNNAALSPNTECMRARYERYVVINYNSVCVNNCGLL